MNGIFAKTSNDSETQPNAWVAGIDSTSTSATVNDLERLPTVGNDPVILFVLYGNQPNTFGDRQRLAVSKFGAKSSNLNERL